MRNLLLAPLLLGFALPVNAGIYYYPFFQKGIEVRCADGEPNHLISFRAGRVMKFEDTGDESYKYSANYLFPEKPDKRYSYFLSTAGTECIFRKLSKKERIDYIKKAKDVCYGGDLETRKKFCYGWN